MLLPECLEDYISETNPVRCIDAFVEKLSATGDESALPPQREMDAAGGRIGYSPQTFAKLFIWGYINRVRSTRRLETEAGRNLELIWLLGKLQPDHSSISRFRKSNPECIKRWLKEFNLICAQLNLFGAEEISIDGVYLKAVNSKRNNYTQAKLEKRLAKLQTKVDAYLHELEQSEADEAPNEEITDIKAKIAQLEDATQKAKEMLKACESSPTGQHSTTDSDARLLTKRTTPGSAVVGYLAQSAVDSKTHLIAATEATQKSDDSGQLTPMAKAALEGMGQEQPVEQPPAKQDVSTLENAPKAPRILADGGYFQINDLAASERAGFEPWVPPNQESKARAGLYPTSDFHYDEKHDSYHCPQKKELTRHSDSTTKGNTYQAYYNTRACRDCPVRAKCTTGRYRKINRHCEEATVQRMRERMDKKPEMYKNRAATVEHPFGSMMFWNEGRNLLCKGLEMANAEFSLSALAYNFKRTLNVVGINALLEAI